MKRSAKLPLRNLLGRPVRTTVLVLLTLLLSLTVFAGSLTVSSLRSGLSSLEARLGADIMVVPYEAATKSDLENIVLRGNTGYFYMDKGIFQQIEAMEGVGEISPQFFLASAKSGCCSARVQIIGIDPETDFTISPWIKKSYGGQLKDLDIVVGSDLNAFVGDQLQFYGVPCNVAAKLEKTGTALDTAVYTNETTIKTLIQSSIEKKMNQFTVDPEQVVSCVLLNVAEGCTVEDVLNDINLHVKKVKAVQTKSMISGVADSLSGVSDIIGVLMIVVWVLDLVILLLAFTMSVNERKKEFAVLRVIGVSRKGLAGIVLQEALLTSVIGSVAGAGPGLVCFLGFDTLIEDSLGLPFLLPGVGQILALVAAAIVVTVTAGGISAAFSAYRISRIDTGLILRGDN